VQTCTEAARATVDLSGGLVRPRFGLFGPDLGWPFLPHANVFAGLLPDFLARAPELDSGSNSGGRPLKLWAGRAHLTPAPMLDGSKPGGPSSRTSLFRPLRESPWQHIPLCGFKFVDARAAPPEGGLCGWLSGERHCGGDGLLFGHVDGEERVEGCPGAGGTSVVVVPRL
jgi:hypothetical protein